jgi:hypothetical protein
VANLRPGNRVLIAAPALQNQVPISIATKRIQTLEFRRTYA